MAGTTVVLNRQVRYERDAARSEKCSPKTRTKVPPSAGPKVGWAAESWMGGLALCSASANWLMKPTQAVKFFSVERGAQSVSSSIEYPCRDQDEG